MIWTQSGSFLMCRQLSKPQAMAGQQHAARCESLLSLPAGAALSVPPDSFGHFSTQSQLCLYSKDCSLNTDNSSLILASCITGYKVTRAMSLANFAAADNAADDHCLT